MLPFPTLFFQDILQKEISMIINGDACFQVMIVDYKLTYPSGTATAYLINGFHAPQGTERAK
jgi:hypothetical protein